MARDRESQFFDAPEHIGTEPNLVSDSYCMKNWDYDAWTGTPQSVRERRMEFAKWMDLVQQCSDGEESADKIDNVSDGGISLRDIDRIVDDNGAVLRTSNADYRSCCDGSSLLNWNDDCSDLSEPRNVNRSPSCKSECQMVENNWLGKIRVRRSDSLQSSVRYGDVSPRSPSVHRQKVVDVEATPRTVQKRKERWLNKWRTLGTLACVVVRNFKIDTKRCDGFSQVQVETKSKTSRVEVLHYRRNLKELSALFMRQDISAHEGSILTMKFSPDGRYLASGGEDKIVRVWEVVEDERSSAVDIPDADPSCVYFSVGDLPNSELLVVEKNKTENLKKTPDSACVVFPTKVFRILEKPLHVFEGHDAEVLDLSWSKDNHLLSSSADKTVRLWSVGVDQCLKVFNHIDYVTCIQFHPLNEDYFISGSIDGKLRIWKTSSCQVVNWIETKNIITAVSYRPDGQGGIIGYITGSCRLFNISDDHMELETEICLSNKRSASNRITGFQFLQQDPSKILVTSADSQVRIVDGLNVIEKYKGIGNAGNQISAAVTSDGKHIVSASDDSHIYVWNYNDRGGDSSFSHPKVVKSFECFTSDASIAIPWSGLNSSPLNESSTNSLPFFSSSCFSLDLLESASTKGSATWPEEQLLMSPTTQSVASSLNRSQYKLLKSCYRSSSNGHAWGMVIVTAGWDGRIRSFQNFGLPMPL